MTINTTRWDSAEYLKTEEDVQLYLEACLEEAGDDPAFIAHALGVVARAKNMSQIAGAKQRLLDCIEEIRAIPDIRGLNEEPAKLTIILRILSSLGWDIFNHQEVIPEYPIKSYQTVTPQRVDYVLQIGGRKLFIEAKAPEEILENHQNQLRDYSLLPSEIPPDFAILTNGISWWFYLPTYKDSWRDCKFYTIDILTQEIEDIVAKFHHLLYRESIESGTAFKYADELSKLPVETPQGEGSADIKSFETVLNGQIKNLGKEFVHKTEGQLDNTRYHRWFETKKPWDEFRLSYMVRLEQGGERPSALIGLFNFVENTVQNPKVVAEKDQRVELLDSWGPIWKNFNYVYVRRSADSWDDEFANTIAESLKRFVETYTPAIEECWHQLKQENT